MKNKKTQPPLLVWNRTGHLNSSYLYLADEIKESENGQVIIRIQADFVHGASKVLRRDYEEYNLQKSST